MDENNIKPTSSEIGALWGNYVNGTMAQVVNKYMASIVEDTSIKALLEDAIQIFEKQKQQIITFLEKDGFPIPIGFSETDLNKDAGRLFTDTLCLNYLYIMTLHGLIGQSTSISVSVGSDLRDFYTSFNNDVYRMYHQTIDLSFLARRLHLICVTGEAQPFRWR